MPTPNTPRGAKRATFTPAHLGAVPSPLTGGEGWGWMPEGAQRTLAQRRGIPLDAPALVASVAASRAAWSSYLGALKAADVAAFDGRPCRLRLDHVHGVYSRARLGAWTAALGTDEGRACWAALVAEGALARALRRATGGAVSLDLIPDLPARCELTDAALAAAEDLEHGRESWHRLRRDIDSAAKACAREALDEMGWEGADD